MNLEHCVGRSFNRAKEEEEEEIPEYLRLHQLVVRRIGEMCRIVNQVKNSLAFSLSAWSTLQLILANNCSLSEKVPLSLVHHTRSSTTVFHSVAL